MATPNSEVDVSSAATVYSVDRFIAEAHGLKQCGICYRVSAKKATTPKKATEIGRAHV
jgi:hypothetical protein